MGYKRWQPHWRSTNDGLPAIAHSECLFRAFGDYCECVSALNMWHLFDRWSLEPTSELCNDSS